MILTIIPAHRGRLPEITQERSRERRPARGADNPAPGRPRAPLSGQYNPGARSSLTAGRFTTDPMKTRPRLHNAAVERREASAPRYGARDASQGVSSVPRSARSGAAFRTSASRRFTPLVREGTKRKRHPVRFEAGKPADRAGGALASWPS